MTILSRLYKNNDVAELEFHDGRVVALYETETFELIELCDWNGCEVSDRIERTVLEELDWLRYCRDEKENAKSDQ